MKTYNIVEKDEILTGGRKIVWTAHGKKDAQNMAEIFRNDNITAVDAAMPFVPYHMRTHEKKLEFPRKIYFFEEIKNKL